MASPGSFADAIQLFVDVHAKVPGKSPVIAAETVGLRENEAFVVGRTPGAARTVESFAEHFPGVAEADTPNTIVRILSDAVRVTVEANLGRFSSSKFEVYINGSKMEPEVRFAGRDSAVIARVPGQSFEVDVVHTPSGRTLTIRAVIDAGGTDTEEHTPAEVMLIRSHWALPLIWRETKQAITLALALDAVERLATTSKRVREFEQMFNDSYLGRLSDMAAPLHRGLFVNVRGSDALPAEVKAGRRTQPRPSRRDWDIALGVVGLAQLALDAGDDTGPAGTVLYRRRHTSEAVIGLAEVLRNEGILRPADWAHHLDVISRR